MSSGGGPFAEAGQQQDLYGKTGGGISLAFAFPASANTTNQSATAPAVGGGGANAQGPLVLSQNAHGGGQHCRNFPIPMMHGFLRPPNVMLPTTNGINAGSNGISYSQISTTQPNSSSSSINRSQRCGVCRGCQCKPCGVCTYCQDSPQFGGPGVKKQSCIERRCLRVLENRLQRDSPTFKARVGCGKCDDCQMPDCQVCLVCLDKRFFANRYMTGALCHKKRCNNSCSLELASHHQQSSNVSPTAHKFPKRSFDSNNRGGGEVEIAFKRGRELAQQSHHNSAGDNGNGRPTDHYIGDSSSTGELVVKMEPADEGVMERGVGNINGTQHTISLNEASSLRDDVKSRQVTHMAYLQQECALSAAENVAHLISQQENPMGTSVQANGHITASAESSLAGMIPNYVNQQLLHMNGIPAYAPNTSSYLLAPACTGGMTTNGAGGVAHYPTAASSIQQAYYNQQQHMRMLVLDNHNYPKYEYCDQRYRYVHGGLIPPPDPFTPPSYSTDTTNAVVLQPL